MKGNKYYSSKGIKSDGLGGSDSDLSTRLNKLEAEITDLNNTFNVLKSTVASFQSEINKLQQEIKNKPDGIAEYTTNETELKKDTYVCGYTNKAFAYISTINDNEHNNLYMLPEDEQPCSTNIRNVNIYDFQPDEESKGYKPIDETTDYVQLTPTEILQTIHPNENTTNTTTIGSFVVDDGSNLRGILVESKDAIETHQTIITPTSIEAENIKSKSATWETVSVEQGDYQTYIDNSSINFQTGPDSWTTDGNITIDRTNKIINITPKVKISDTTNVTEISPNEITTTNISATTTKTDNLGVNSGSQITLSSDIVSSNNTIEAKNLEATSTVKGPTIEATSTVKTDELSSYTTTSNITLSSNIDGSNKTIKAKNLEATSTVKTDELEATTTKTNNLGVKSGNHITLSSDIVSSNNNIKAKNLEATNVSATSLTLTNSSSSATFFVDYTNSSDDLLLGRDELFVENFCISKATSSSELPSWFTSKFSSSTTFTSIPILTSSSTLTDPPTPAISGYNIWIATVSSSSQTTGETTGETTTPDNTTTP